MAYSMDLTTGLIQIEQSRKHSETDFHADRNFFFSFLSATLIPQFQFLNFEVNSDFTDLKNLRKLSLTQIERFFKILIGHIESAIMNRNFFNF